MDTVWAWLQQQLDAILEALNPIHLVMGIADFLASMLPTPDPNVVTAFETIPALVASFINFFVWLDFFLDLRMLTFTLGVMLTFESLLLILRLWRTIRSLAT